MREELKLIEELLGNNLVDTTLREFTNKVRHLDSIGCHAMATWLIENVSLYEGAVIESATDEQLERARMDEALLRALDRFGGIAR